MKIQLENWKVQELSLSVLNDETRKENSFNLNSGNFFPEEDNKTFGVGFTVEIKDKRFNLSIEATFIFSLEEEVTEEFKVSNFPKINAPAIAFPYLRAYISNLTLQSGFDPIILPSINFVKLSKED
ncbi:protein-export chaperone SecB [Geofilum sp. OHC36d9]|uniref:protein-export chaperone SecB n=1 Tax=Geofilum sp. OHC36d9 TaxID=3458413 RepID=UPI004033A19A